MRYIKCFALQVNNEYLPYLLLDYVEDEDYGSSYKYGNVLNDDSVIKYEFKLKELV